MKEIFKERKKEVILTIILLSFIAFIILFGSIHSLVNKENPEERLENLKRELSAIINLNDYETNIIYIGGSEYSELTLKKENETVDQGKFSLKLKDKITIDAGKTQEETAKLLDDDIDYDGTIGYSSGSSYITFHFKKDYEGNINSDSHLCKYEISSNYPSDNENFIIGEKITNKSSFEDILKEFGAPSKIYLSGYDTNNATIIKFRYGECNTVYIEFTVEFETNKITNIVCETEPLSNSCDVILSTGRDENGSLFELVGYEYEDYTGTTTKIGVIKDNKWLVEPTSDFPFINNGKLLTNRESIFSIDSKNNPDYIGNGCFEFDDIIYNCNNGKSFNIRKELGLNAYSKKDFGNTDNNQRNNILLLLYNLRIYTLNTSNMEYSMIIESSYTTRAYNDGLFAAKLEYGGSFAFYNAKGEQIIDISMYNLKKENNGRDVSSDLIFNSGKCTFDIVNDKGSVYSITIDKTGKVLESTKIK